MLDATLEEHARGNNENGNRRESSDIAGKIPESGTRKGKKEQRRRSRDNRRNLESLLDSFDWSDS